MHSHVSKWGNSLAVRLPKAICEALHVGEGSAIEMELEDGRLVIRPARPHFTLDELVEGMTEENKPESFDDGPMGKELI